MKSIGIHFVGMTQHKTPALGIAISVVHVKTGESGIVKTVIGALMEYPCHVSTAVVPKAHSPNQDIKQAPNPLVL